MRRLATLIASAAIGLGAGGAATASPAADMARADASTPAPRLITGVYRGEPVGLEKTQYYWGGRRYCWYDGGWRGPGWYYCGYAWRRGWGWGGPIGWRGWARPGWHGGYHGGYYGRYHGGWHGDRGWHGDHGRGDWRRGDHDGGWRGGGHHPH